MACFIFLCAASPWNLCWLSFQLLGDEFNVTLNPEIEAESPLWCRFTCRGLGCGDFKNKKGVLVKQEFQRTTLLLLLCKDTERRIHVSTRKQVPTRCWHLHQGFPLKAVRSIFLYLLNCQFLAFCSIGKTWTKTQMKLLISKSILKL